MVSDTSFGLIQDHFSSIKKKENEKKDDKKFIQSLGLELESFLLSSLYCHEGREYRSPLQLFFNSDLKNFLNDVSFSPEIASCEVEGKTKALFRENTDFFDGHFSDALGMFGKKRQKAREMNVHLLQSGSVPFTYDMLDAYYKWIYEIERFFRMVEKQNDQRLFGPFPYRINLPVQGNRSEVYIPKSSAMYALTGQHSMNVGTKDRLGFTANLLTALMPLAAIFSNSRAASDGIGLWHWNRLYYALNGMGSRGKLMTLSKGDYLPSDTCEALLEWIRYVSEERELLLPAHEGGTKGEKDSPWAEIKARMSQSWMLAPRIALLEDPKLAPWVEVNAVDTQPTLADGMALDLLMLGNLSYWSYKGLEDVSSLMPFDQIERTCHLIAQKGPYIKDRIIRWDGSLYSPVEWVLDRLIPDAIEGIESDNLCSTGLATKLMSILERTLRKECTGSDWTLVRANWYIKEYGYPESLAISQTLTDMARIQETVNIPNQINNPQGWVDLF